MSPSAGGSPTYLAAMEPPCENTDYHRFDDTLRILLDCTAAQAERIESMLAGYTQQGVLNYGVYRSAAALMTCLIFSLEKAEHIHFVDGNDGGFTSAAKNLKAKLKLCI